MIVRSVLLLGVLVLVTMLPLWASGLVLFCYVAVYRGFELVPLMVLMDGYYGAWPSTPHLTVLALFVVIVGVLIKPLLRVYTRDV